MATHVDVSSETSPFPSSDVAALHMTTAQNLAGIKVAVTRPAKQAGALCQSIEALGGQAITFPTLDILPVEPSAQTSSLVNRLQQFDIVIFVSVNAVEGAARLTGDTLPSELMLIAVGDSTRRAVEQRWQRDVTCPDTGANSEALLQLQTLQLVRGRNILIFRGQGGRELLADTLIQRGARVEYAEVYRRARPKGDLGRLISRSPDLITATSNASLQNLYDMASPEQRDWLLSRQLLVMSERTAKLALQLGFQHPAIVSTQNNDQGLVGAMLAWHSNTQHNNH